MKTKILKTQTVIKRPLKEVFSFFQNPENLEKITPPELSLRITSAKPVQMQKNAQIEYTLKVRGVPSAWTTLIDSYEPPYYFTDIQVKGPYRLWRHMHQFHETLEGTLMIDEVHYALPMGILGEIAHGLFVRKDLEKIFSYRRKRIQELFG